MPSKSKKEKKQPPAGMRRYLSRGVEVEIRDPGDLESNEKVELTLDGLPVDVSLINGKYYSQLAHPFLAFDSIDEIVDTLMANEGRTWTLHGGLDQDRPDTGHPHPHHG
jgi:hypothetical protein